MLIGLLIRKVIIHNHTKCIPLSNPKCMTQPNLIDSPLFVAVKLDRCVGSCNTLTDLSNKACVPNKTEDLYERIFNMIAAINE